MRYKVTIVHNDEYCYLKPYEEDCRYSVMVDAKSKGEAVLKICEQAGLSYNRKLHSACPLVWEVTEERIKRD